MSQWHIPVNSSCFCFAVVDFLLISTDSSLWVSFPLEHDWINWSYSRQWGPHWNDWWCYGSLCFNLPFALACSSWNPCLQYPLYFHTAFMCFASFMGWCTEEATLFDCSTQPTHLILLTLEECGCWEEWLEEMRCCWGWYAWIIIEHCGCGYRFWHNWMELHFICFRLDCWCLGIDFWVSWILASVLLL